jgi:hypothetical protein
MNAKDLWTSIRWVPAAILMGVLAACGTGNNLPRSTQVVDGITIDIGVVPAGLVQGHSTDPADPLAMHGGTPKGGASHHLVVALFDAKTGIRLTDVRVRAAVGHRSYDHALGKVLEPMQIAGTTTYGGFFQMADEGLWTIHLEIERPGMNCPVQAEFAYEHPTDY